MPPFFPRRMLGDPRQFVDGMDWSRLRRCVDHRPGLMPGYLLLFHADDLYLAERPWYDVTFRHAGGGDGYFQSRWPRDRKVWLPSDVLHMGPHNAQWFGRSSSGLEEMSRYKVAKGWENGPDGKRGKRGLPVAERVEVPGHESKEWVYR